MDQCSLNRVFMESFKGTTTSDCLFRLVIMGTFGNVKFDHFVAKKLHLLHLKCGISTFTPPPPDSNVCFAQLWN